MGKLNRLKKRLFLIKEGEADKAGEILRQPH